MNSHFTPRFSLLSLAIAAVLMAPLTADAAGYALKDANRSNIKKAAWVCKGCAVKAEKEGFAQATIAVQQGNDKHISNTTGTDADGATGNLSGGYTERDQDATRTEFTANRLGFDDGSAAFTLSSPGFYKISAKYRELSRFYSTGMTPYILQGDVLVLPPDWQFAGTTTGMTGLDYVIPVDLQKKRHRYEIDGKVASEQFNTDLNFRHETRKGKTRSAVNLLTNAAMIAKPIDDATDTVDARVFWHGNNLLAGLTGQASKYYNDYSKLTFENAFTPTFGAAYDGQMSVAPDNQALSIGGDVQYFRGRQQALAHLRYSRMSQDDALLPATINGPSPVLPVSAIDTQVDVTEMILRYNLRPTSELGVKVNYSYRDHDNQTPQYLFPQILTDSIFIGDAENLPYDRTRKLLTLGADYRFSRTWALDANYSYLDNAYDFLSRANVYENQVVASLRAQLLENLQLRLIGQADSRTGSNYLASDYTDQANQAAMRQYFLANRDKREIKLMTESSVNALALQFNVHTGVLDYPDSPLGLTQERYTGFGLNGSYPLTEALFVNAFFGKDWRDSNQVGSNAGVDLWYAQNRDKSTFATLGLKWAGLLESRLDLGLDYLYSDGSSDTDVSQGISNFYGPYSATRNTVTSYADYQLNDDMSVRLEWIFEDYRDLDWANDGLAPDAIPNLILLGGLGQDYSAHYVGLSFNYQW